MAWNWGFNSIINTIIAAAWGNERSKAIEQLAKDLYLNPSNDNDGNPNLSYPLEKGVPFKDGIIACAGPTGVVVAFPTGISFGTADEYGVNADFQETTNGQGGEIYFTKALNQVTIHNSGAATGRKIYFRLFRVATS